MSVGLLEDLFGFDSRRTLQFFTDELQELGGHHKFNERQLLYVASVLTHYSLVSWTDGRPATIHVNEKTVPFAFTRTELSPYIFENLSPEFKEPRDAGDCENKGSHIFLMIGFFRQQISMENNISLYEKLAQSYYYRAFQYSNDTHRKTLFRDFSDTLPEWSQACHRLNQLLHDKRYLLQLEK